MKFCYARAKNTFLKKQHLVDAKNEEEQLMLQLIDSSIHCLIGISRKNNISKFLSHSLSSRSQLF